MAIKQIKVKNKGVLVSTLSANYFNIIVLLILGIIVFLNWNKQNRIEHWSIYVTYASLILIVYQCAIFKIKSIGVSDFRYIFILASYLFMFGRVYLNAYNLDNGIFWNLLPFYSFAEKYHACWIILLNLQGIFTGFVWKDTFCNRSMPSEKVLKNCDDNELNSILKTVGMIIFLLTLPFRLYEDLVAIFQSQVSSSYNYVVASSGLSDDFALLFFPSIIFLMIGFRENKKIVKIIVAVAFFYMLSVMTLTGDRRYQTTAILSLVLCFIDINSDKRKKSSKKILPLGVLAYFFLNLLAVIRYVRIGNLQSLGGFFKLFSNYMTETKGLGVLYETLSEFGLTFFSVTGIVKYIPSVIDYQKGLGFFGAIPSILPIGWMFGDSFQKVSISRTINALTNTSVGGSIIGDLYANFGYYSPIVGILFGYLLSKIMHVNVEKRKIYYLARYYSLFYILINLVRSSFMEIFRVTAWFLILQYFLLLFISNKKLRVRKVKSGEY